MKIPVELPIVVKVDNMGAIYMTENATGSSRTRHIDTRIKYVNILQEDGMIKTEFVGTDDNVADIGTKNVKQETMVRHESKIVSDKSHLLKQEGC